jgi:2-polyprenyl-3-methyl-5-hydroxy-6-metoxy-1,4-benzoquinol methylase
MAAHSLVQASDGQEASAFAALTERQRAMWEGGDFARVGTPHVIVGERLARAVDVHPGERVLDVAAGSGNASLAAARRGGRVIATDFVASLLEAARRRAEAEGLVLETRVADAQELPFEAASFDVVLSTFGAMFGPDQQRVADELTRVCRPGGRIGMANWTPASLVCSHQAITARHVPPPHVPGLHHPVEWGTEERLRELFGDHIAEVRARRRSTDMCAPSAAEHVAFNRRWLGPSRAAFAQLDGAGQERLAAELAADLERFNRAGDGTLVAASEYLEVVLVRS